MLTDNIVEFSLFASLLELKLFIFSLAVLWLSERIFSTRKFEDHAVNLKKSFKTALRFLEFGVHFYWTVKNLYQRIMKAIGAQV